MTCIVGIESPHSVTLGADSWSSSICGLSNSLGPQEAKVFLTEFGVMGSSGSSRLANCLRHLLKVEMPKKPLIDALSRHRWMIERFVPAVRKMANKQGLELRSLKDDEDDDSGEMLVGLGNSLFHVGCDLAVERAGFGFYAIGQGAPYAMGALYERTFSDPFVGVKHALGAAEKFCMFVRKPFETRST